MQLRRADTTLSGDTELANITYNDKYVVVYSFKEIGSSTPESLRTSISLTF
jgi:anoctamin-10